MHISHELLTTWGSNSAGVVTKIQTSRKFDRIQLVGKQPQDIHQMAEAYYKSLSATISMRTGIKWIVKGMECSSGTARLSKELSTRIMVLPPEVIRSCLMFDQALSIGPNQRWSSVPTNCGVTPKL